LMERYVRIVVSPFVVVNAGLHPRSDAGNVDVLV